MKIILTCLAVSILIISCQSQKSNGTVLGQDPGFTASLTPSNLETNWVKKALFAAGAAGGKQEETNSKNRQLYIPELLDAQEIDGKKHVTLEAHKSAHAFTGRAVPSLAYNNETYLGPTIKFQRGDSISFSVINSLNEASTLHPHGLIVPAYADGNIHQLIPGGETWRVEYDIIQEAGTFWYHPHRMGKTAEQVYYGLAGMIIIEDEHSQSLDLPSEYGVDDIPLIIQDKELSSSGRQKYQLSMHSSRMGFIGRTVLVNGMIKPELNVTRGLVRLRILNASNFGIHRYSLTGADVYLISNGATFLEKPERVSVVTVSTGERRELLVDFRSSKAKNPVLYASVHGAARKAVLTFNVEATKNVGTSIPSVLRQAVEVPETEKLDSRVFELWSRGMRNGTAINGQSMDPRRIDFTIPSQKKELWTVQNIPLQRGMMSGNLPHSFHLHGTLFTVLSYNERAPPIEYQGLQDTVLVLPNVRIEILVEFSPYKGLFMYHCHLLEHEDAGMMGQFTVM